MTDQPTKERPHEYHLMFWGEVQNDDKRWIERDLGITGRDFWFATAGERSEFKAKLKACADSHKCCIAFSEHDGPDVRLLTIARMTMRLADGRAFSFEYNFGYGYPPSAAEYMFQDGNYSCDCNKSLFLQEAGHDVQEGDCGDEIMLDSFRVTQETDPDGTKPYGVVPLTPPTTA